MPKRYWMGAVLSVALGAAIAATAVVTTSGSSQAAKPVPVAPSQLADESILALWRTKPVEQVFPPTVTLGSQYVRLGIAPAAGCDVLPKAFGEELATDAPGAGCVKVLRATYTDITQTVFATVGVVVVGGEASARDKVWRQWTPDADSRRPELMPDVFPVPATVAAGFADNQRVTWNSQASNDGSYLVYVVSGFADGRAGSTAAQSRTGSGKALVADSPPVQAASGLSDLFAGEFTNAGKGQ
ncbi:hypothetical protein [Catenulispora pinisilvae]|uniref:hypothetical protein n=1 Tax=Catenulispora pinisilvae TaxID=2705253 RepID=UPI001890DA51|nr:hypothetical protein [Catenulispora pinisilvae]